MDGWKPKRFFSVQVRLVDEQRAYRRDARVRALRRDARVRVREAATTAQREVRGAEQTLRCEVRARQRRERHAEVEIAAVQDADHATRP